VVVVDRDWKGEIANRLDRVGRYHASRTILCAVQEGRAQLDARAVLSSEEPSADGGLGVIRERVELDLGRRHLGRLGTIIDPILASELPTILWSPHGYREAVEALLGTVDVILIDSDDLDDFAGPEAALERAGDLREHAYVVDLAWLRTTPWRERLASAFDEPQRRGALERLNRVTVRFQPASHPSALLLAGWMAARLGWAPQHVQSAGGTLHAAARRGGGDSQTGTAIDFDFEPVEQDVPGISGVTVACPDGFSLSLDRGRGGLRARQRDPSGREREWQVLGASRGEGGILGEGVRQALLRDPTYGPALEAARRFCA
jgi:hypothetical protein